MNLYSIGSKNILAVFVICLVAILIAMPLWPNATRKHVPDFQAYEPTILPPTIHVTSKTLESWHGEINQPELLLRLNEANITIAEKHSVLNEQTDGTCTGAVNETCQQFNTPLHQKYTIDTTAYNKSASKTISFTKGDTFICISLNQLPVTPIDNDIDWNKIIDSFHPISLGGIHTEQIHAGS